MSGPAVCVGIDVAKATLDLAVRPSGQRWTVANEATTMPELVEALEAQAPTLVVLEATGGFEHVVVAALAAAGLPVVIANPRQVRDSAGATGQLAKTDAIDAQILALFSRTRSAAERVGCNNLFGGRHQYSPSAAIVTVKCLDIRERLPGHPRAAS